MSTQFNPDHLDHLDQLEQVRKQWQESEWRLSFLRTETGTPLTAASDEEIWEWSQQHHKHPVTQINQNKLRQIQFHQ